VTFEHKLLDKLVNHHPSEDGHWDIVHIRKLLNERDALLIEATRYRYLKSIMYWDDERDFGPGGRYWLALLAKERKPDIDALIDSQASGGTKP
jgi:hypothetical protein